VLLTFKPFNHTLILYNRCWKNQEGDFPRRLVMDLYSSVFTRAFDPSPVPDGIAPTPPAGFAYLGSVG
jgi:hypothetical protein